MPASALPGATDLQGVATLDDLRGFLHVGDDVWGAIIHQAGDPGAHIRVVAALPPQVVVQSSVSATLPNGDNLTAVQATARNMVHIWVGLSEVDFVDVDRWAVVSGEGGANRLELTIKLMVRPAGDKLKNVF